MNLKDTLNLPNPDFSIPMKAGLPQLEQKLQAKWDEIGIYQLIQNSRKDAPAYTLHDGPPYTNGPIHVGTALNKILKDFVVKSQTMMGKRAPYVPGYDNHGLPIEQAVMKKFKDKKIEPTIVELRQACREHAEHYIGVQTEQFKRLGVFGMWDKPYTSMGFAYEAELIRVFKRLVEGGYIYRGLRPVLWSPTSQTALADTEILYQEHTSKSIYVKFPLLEDKNNLLGEFENVSCIIWTTTPWTIPANLAVAFHPHLTYVVASTPDHGHLIVLKDLLEKTFEKCNITTHQIVKEFKGAEIEFTEFKHPVFDRKSTALLADYVTTEDGTGIVHTAPGHGREDFFTGQKYGLPVLCPVDAKGVLTDEAGEFEGVHYSKCDTVVVDRLQELGALLNVSDYHHQYPHAERDGMPVIFRATEQWFIGIDKPFHLDESLTLRQKMLQEIEGVKWHPESSIGRIKAMVENRPDWCISRQRPWGVGIPVFYGKESGQPVMDIAAIEAVAKLVQEKGSDSWYSADPSEILPNGYKHPETGETEFVKEVDVFDVWFDSGATHLAVLEGIVEPDWKEDLPADLYLEGSDQHRGWFNVSLILGTACRGHAPYKEVVTHGFVTDGEGKKMSKRFGNVIDPVQTSNESGAEILRYWSASVNYADDVPCSPELLKIAGENYRTVRNTLRFLLANLSDYNPNDPAELSQIDRWVMQATDELSSKVIKSYAEYDFDRANAEIHNFCVNELSRFYLDAIKDSMYCDGADWPTRRGAQKACHYVLNRMVRLTAPILCHTAEETYERIPHISHLPTIHAEEFLKPEMEFDWDLYKTVSTLLTVRSRVFAQFEIWKKESGLKNSQDAEANIVVTEEEMVELTKLSDQLANLFKMAHVQLSTGEPSVSFRQSDYPMCDRSRIRRADVNEVTIEGETFNLSQRDQRALNFTHA